MTKKTRRDGPNASLLIARNNNTPAIDSLIIGSGTANQCSTAVGQETRSRALPLPRSGRAISTDRARRAVWVRRVNRSTAKRCHNTCSIELLVRGMDDSNDGRSAWARTGVTCSSGSGSAEIVGRRGPLVARQASPGVLPSRRTVSRVFWPVGLLPPSGCVCCQACQGCGLLGTRTEQLELDHSSAWGGEALSTSQVLP